jgi:hypothetical protein
MTEHPENEEWMNELIRSVSSQELVDVWCSNCDKFVKMNAAFSKYVKGEIKSCGSCRGK